MYDLKDERWITNLQGEGREEKSVVLTFDDGPGRQTVQILDILKAKNAPAVFFWQSRLLYGKRPWQRLFHEGHTLGSHAHKHVNLTTLNTTEQFKQIKTSIEILESVTRRQVKYFRPPFGQYNEDTLSILKELNLFPVMWDISSFDWNHRNEPFVIVDNVLNNIKPGSVILLHELPQTVSILSQLIDKIRCKGFKLTTLT
ncbi:polysaccharide deacetylase family protein [Neobacillus sp. LXY-4]|uniref:polysaccharide deacetylase family protein n=1 Tax=Neobacillus sp. LXY-4 TaxID=3379826 RepID=UPI003EE3CFE2